MSSPRPVHATLVERAGEPKRMWNPPRLTRHESLTVLTQSFLGAHLGVQFDLMQITCSVNPQNPNCLGGGP